MKTKLEQLHHLLESGRVTVRTREVLLDRIGVTPSGIPQFFTAPELACLVAIAAVVVPHESAHWRTNVAGEIDARLFRGDGKGWRYAELLPEPEMYKQGLELINRGAQERFSGRNFADLEFHDQEHVLRLTFENGSVAVWADLFWEELLVDIVEAYYAHPYAQATLGAFGMADIADRNPPEVALEDHLPNTQ